MNKPVSMVYEEFKQELANLINNSGLPPFVLEAVLQNYLNEVNALAKNQYHLDKKQYDEFLSKQDLSKDDKEKD